MQDPSESFYRARKNVIDMLINRGYLDQATGRTEDLQNRYISYDEFKQLFQAGGIAMDLAGIITKEGLPVYVKFIPKEIAKADLYTVGDATGIFNDIATGAFNMDKLKHDPQYTDLRAFFQKIKVITVFVAARNNKKDKFVTTVEKSFMMPEYPNVELWPSYRLQVNYSKHALARPTRILTEIEKQAVLHRFQLNVAMMPEMCIDDPQNRWFDGKPDDVYKIMTGTGPHYVRVVNRKMPISG